MNVGSVTVHPGTLYVPHFGRVKVFDRYDAHGGHAGPRSIPERYAYKVSNVDVTFIVSVLSNRGYGGNNALLVITPQQVGWVVT